MKNFTQNAAVKFAAVCLSFLLLVSCKASDQQALGRIGTTASDNNTTESATVTTSVSEGTTKTSEITSYTEETDITDFSTTTTQESDEFAAESSVTDITTTGQSSAETTTQTTTRTTSSKVTTQTEPTATVTASQPISTKETDMKVIGYLTTWNYSCYKTLDWDNLTHINIAFVNPDKNGVFKNDIGSDSTLQKIVDTAHANGVKVLASLGGWGGSVNYPDLVSNTAGINRLNANLLEFVEKFSLDGIDIDVEGDVDKELWNHYEEWISSLRKLCDDEGLLLTTACAKWYASYISDDTLRLFDLVNIMVYDNTSEKNHASMEYAKASLEYFESKGIEKSKLVLGVPFYARNPDFGYMSYQDIIATDESAYNRDYYGEFSYNGKYTMAAKCELAKDYGGIMIWELGEDASEPFSLLEIIGEKVLK